MPEPDTAAEPVGVPVKKRTAHEEKADIETLPWSEFDARRLPLPKFNVASDTEIQLIENELYLEWTVPQQASAVEIRLYDVTRSRVVSSWLRKTGSGILHLKDCEPGRYSVSARCAFPLRMRWGPKVNVCYFVIGEESERAARRAAFERVMRRRGQFASLSGRSIAENVSLLLNNLARQDTELDSVPLWASISLGYDCNANCLHCDEGRVRRPHRIPESLIKDIVEIAVPNGLCGCEIIGGEPLMYDETEAIAKSIEERNPDCMLTLSTNGMLLGSKWDTRTATGRLSIQISMDGASKETFERVRRKLDFDRITANMRRIKGVARDNPRWCGFTVNFVIMEPNKHEIVSMVELAPELGIRSVHFNLLENPFNHGDLNELNPISSLEAAECVLKDLREAAALASQLGISFSSRAEARVLNAYPTLCETRDDVAKLPADLAALLQSSGRVDLRVIDAPSAAEMLRLTELREGEQSETDYRLIPREGEQSETDHRLIPREGEQSETDYRLIPWLGAAFEATNAEGLGYLRSLEAQGARFCDYPFTKLHLDTYRTYVCCQATDAYLYGHRYDQAVPRMADVWNGDFMQSAREQMYKGGFDSVCHTRCVYYAGGGTYEHLAGAAGVVSPRSGLTPSGFGGNLRALPEPIPVD